MGGVSQALPYKITSWYESLVTAFKEACENADCGVVKAPQSILARFRCSGRELVSFECCLHLHGWKARGSSAKNRIHILVHVQEEIRRSDTVLVCSTVRVNYYEVDDANARLLQCIRYDYGETQAHKERRAKEKRKMTAHPFFHAQSASEPIELGQNDASEIEFEYQVRLGEVGCFKNTRIPTSDMTFPSVLLCLAADHFARPFFEEFMKKVLEIQDKMPQPAFEKLKASLAAESNHLRSSHWFAHMRN